MANVLEPYKHIIGAAAGASSILQYFAGITICYEIIKRKNTMGIPAMCFIGSMALAFLGLKYAIILNDTTTFDVYSVCIALNICYLLIYLRYSKSRWRDVFQPLCQCFTLVALMYSYADIEDKEKVEFRYGLIMTVMLLLFLASPLKDITQMIRDKDASGIPFPIIFMSMIASILWMVYSIAISNTFMIIQNLAAVLICATQILLCVIYPGVEEEDLYNRRYF